MRVRVLFFASYREVAGRDETEVILPDDEPVSVAGLVERLRASDPALSALPSDPPAAVNRAWAPPGTVLGDGDEVALLPPVAGG